MTDLFERVAQARGARGDDVPTIPVDPSLIEDHSSAGQVALAVAPAAALILAMAGSQVSQAIAPDEETADAWSWNHTMRACLEDRGIRLP